MTLQWQKLDFLRPLGLKPWNNAAASAPSTPVPIPVPTPPVTIKPPVPNPAPTPPTPSKPPVVSPVPTPPVTAPPVTSACSARFAVGSSWGDGATRTATVNVWLKNTGTKPIGVPWQLSWENPNYDSVSGPWTWSPSSMASGVLKGTVTPSWAALVPGGSEVNVGAQITGNSSDLAPHKVSINGVECHLSNSLAAKTSLRSVWRHWAQTALVLPEAASPASDLADTADLLSASTF